MFRSYGLTEEQAAPIVQALSEHSKAWTDFMMCYELGLEYPDPRRALIGASTIAVAYIAGGMIPLSPYIVLFQAQTALLWSVAVTLAALMVFGYVKGRFTGKSPFRSAFQTALVGGLAAAAAFGIARAIS